MDSVGLEPGAWTDVQEHGQFLLDLEFLTRYSRMSGGMCVYCKAPSYLAEIAALFPWLHFYAYELKPEAEDYDPNQPELSAPMTVQVRSGCFPVFLVL